MNKARDSLLSHPAFSGDDNGGISESNSFGKIEYFLHLVTRYDHSIHVKVFSQDNAQFLLASMEFVFG